MDKIKAQKSSNRIYVVMSGAKPAGIIRSVDMFRLLGTPFGVALNYKKRLRAVMYSNILIVDYTITVDEVSRKAMARAYEDVYDDILVTREQQFIGVIPVYELLNFMTEFKLKEAVQQNPLTRLPGNERIHGYLAFKMEQKQPFSVIYIDIDHFKSYNDVYGFKYGDDVLKWVGRMLTSLHFPEMFVGHIGADDFISCLSSNYAEEYCKQVIEQFDSDKKRFYSDEDHSNNYIHSLDREHKMQKYPLITLSIVIIDISSEGITQLSEISLAAAKYKKQAKQIHGSNYIKVS